MSKIDIVNKMIEAGYHLMGESAESFANRWSEEMLMTFLKNFTAWKEG